MTAHEFWLLDLDGTILGVEEDYIHETIEAVGDRIDRQFTDDEAVAIWYGRDGLRDDILQQYEVDPADFWVAFHDIESPKRRAEATYLHDDARVITDLDGPRAVVTHCQPYLLEPILHRLEIGAWFDAIVTGSDRLGWKPDPAPLEHAMAKLNINGERGAMVGDSVADVQAASNAGVTGILVDRDGTTPSDDADHIVTSLEELI